MNPNTRLNKKQFKEIKEELVSIKWGLVLISLMILLTFALR